MVMNLLIVDDEAAVRAGLIELCERSEDLCVVGEASTGGDGINAAAVLRPDLLLLGAELPDMTGFQALRALSLRNQRRTILVSASAEHAAAAAGAGAHDFLLKPVSAGAFTQAIGRARGRLGRGGAAQFEEPPLRLVGERAHRLHPLEPQRIDYIESAGNYVKYRVGNAEYIARETLKRLDAALRPLGFVRIERSLLVNIRAISYAEPTGRGTFAFTLHGGACLHSGFTFRDNILGALPLRRRGSLHDDAR
jgi:DNA-binding LytR/AlgR family response regulator